MSNMLKIKLSKDFNLDIYGNNDFGSLLNSYNSYTKKNIQQLKELYEKLYFVVPSTTNDLAWGKEKVFIPFTNKLFKIINTDKGNTSLQLHPLKTEKYISLSNSTLIIDDNKTYSLKYNQYMCIPKNTIHSQIKGSIVFEEQDNNLLDNHETIRIYDSLDRQTHSKKEYYKYLLPSNKNYIKLLNKYTNSNKKNTDKFIFIIDGYVTIKVNNQDIKLDKLYELYFVSKKIPIKKINGNVL